MVEDIIDGDFEITQPFNQGNQLATAQELKLNKPDGKSSSQNDNDDEIIDLDELSVGDKKVFLTERERIEYKNHISTRHRRRREKEQRDFEERRRKKEDLEKRGRTAINSLKEIAFAKAGRDRGEELANMVYTEEGRDRTDAAMQRLTRATRAGLLPTRRRRRYDALLLLNRSDGYTQGQMSKQYDWQRKFGDDTSLDETFKDIADTRRYLIDEKIPVDSRDVRMSKDRSAYRDGFRGGWDEAKANAIGNEEVELPWYYKEIR